jgi:hypothetical protein
MVPVPGVMPIGAGATGATLELDPPLCMLAIAPPAAAAPAIARMITIFPEPPFAEGTAMLNCVMVARAVRP